MKQEYCDQEIRRLICDLCRQFYNLGWVSGTGGGISIRQGDCLYMAPSAIQKEHIRPDDIFVMDREGNIVSRPQNGLKVSSCKPLFIHAYNIRNAGAVIHSHSINAVLVTLIYERTFKTSNLEMMKGIEGVGVFETHEVPIIVNTSYEPELADSMAEAIRTHPGSNAVLVRGHGVYVWGNDWVQAKTQAECYDYLFAAAVHIKRLGLDPEKGGLP